MKFPNDFQYIRYNDTTEEIQSTIDEYIKMIETSEEGIEEVSTGNVTVTKYGERYFVTVKHGCWIPK